MFDSQLVLHLDISEAKHRSCHLCYSECVRRAEMTKPRMAPRLALGGPLLLTGGSRPDQQ